MKFRKTLKVLAASALLFGTVGLATACGDNNGGTTDVKGLIINEDAKVIRGDFNLVDKYLGCDLTWTSSNENIAKITKGEGTYKVTVTRPDKDTDVTLTATSGKYTKEFKITVPAIDVSEIASAYTFAYNKKNISTGEYDLDAKTTYNGKEATIAWEIADEYKASAVIKDGKLAVTGTKDKTSVTIQATFTYSDKTSIKKYTFNAFDDPVTNDVVTKVEVGVPYIYHLTQGKTNKELYFAGTMSGKYGATTTDKTQAIKIYFEAVEGGYSISFTNSENKKQYLNMVLADATKDYDSKNNKPQTSIDDTAKTVWTWNEEYNIAVAKFGNDTYYLGTYNTFDTISPSLISYAKTSFPLHLTPVTDIVTTPEVGVKYDFVMLTEEARYFVGKISNHYGVTTTKLSESLPITLETVTGGYNITYTDSDSKTKKYINVVASGKYINFVLEDSASSVFTWDEKKNTLVTFLNEKAYYIGFSGTYTTIGAYEESKLAYPLQLRRHYDNLIINAENTDEAKLDKAVKSFESVYTKDTTVTLSEGVTATVKEGTTASSVSIKDNVIIIKPTENEEKITLVIKAGEKTKEVSFTAKKVVESEIPADALKTSLTRKADVETSSNDNKITSDNLDLLQYLDSSISGIVKSVVVIRNNQDEKVTQTVWFGYNKNTDTKDFRFYAGQKIIITLNDGYVGYGITSNLTSGYTYEVSADGKTITIYPTATLKFTSIDVAYKAA